MGAVFVEGGIDEFIIIVEDGNGRDDGDTEYQKKVLPGDGEDASEEVLIDVGVGLSAGDQNDGDTNRKRHHHGHENLRIALKAVPEKFDQKRCKGCEDYGSDGRTDTDDNPDGDTCQ